MSFPDTLLELIEEGIQLQQLEQQEAEHAAQEKADRAAQLFTAIETRWIESNGRFGVTLHRGHEASPLWTMLFRENWERERFRDWWVHQHHRLADVARCVLGRNSSVRRPQRSARQSPDVTAPVRRRGRARRQPPSPCEARRRPVRGLPLASQRLRGPDLQARHLAGSDRHVARPPAGSRS